MYMQAKHSHTQTLKANLKIKRNREITKANILGKSSERKEKRDLLAKEKRLKTKSPDERPVL